MAQEGLSKSQEIQNAVSDAKQGIEEAKKELLGAVSLLKTFCSDFPKLPSFKIQWLDIEDVIKLLLDLIGSILGIQIPEIRDMVTQWLAKTMKSLEKNINLTIKDGLKSCFACKINPKIPNWMFVDGINIEVEQIDLTCVFKINPDSDVGQMLYDNTQVNGSYKDMDRFLFDVIQENGTTKVWNSPLTFLPIAKFTFYENSSTNNTFVGYDKSAEQSTDPNNKGKQNIDKRNNVINMKIDESYRNKSFIDFVNDYVNSLQPLFDSEKVMSQAMDFIYGVISKKIKLDETCLEKQAEFDETVEELITCGIDDPNVILDDSFFEFNNKQIVNIKKRVEERKRGIIKLDNCGGAESLVDFDSVKNFNQRLKNAPTLNERVTVINNGLDQFASISANNVSEENKTKGKWQFIIDLINAIKVVIVKLVLSPKLNFIIISLFYLVNGQARFISIKDYIKNIICILRPIIEELLKKLIYELLLPLVIKGLATLVKCYVQIKIRAKKEQILQQNLSLIPGAADLINEGFNLAEGAANSIVDAGADNANNQITNNLNT